MLVVESVLVKCLTIVTDSPPEHARYQDQEHVGVEVAGIGLEHHDDADESAADRQPAPQTHFFTEKKKGGECRENRRGKTQGCRFGGGHRGQTVKPGQHGDDP